MAAKKKSVAKSSTKSATSIKPQKKATTPAKKKAVAVKVKPKLAARKPAVVTKPVATKKPDAAPEVSLGRPLVTQEEKLYMLFKDDFHARQIFEFLRVQTVKELEQYSPSQIVRIISKPITNTVERIRQRLAELKRSLREDENYAAEFLATDRGQAKSAPRYTSRGGN